MSKYEGEIRDIQAELKKCSDAYGQMEHVINSGISSERNITELCTEDLMLALCSLDKSIHVFNKKVRRK